MPTEYGKVRGRTGGASVNGASVLADLFSQRGMDVDRYRRLSPRIDRYETIVWFPDQNAAPRQEVVDRLEEWLSNGYRRTLIYVGGGYAGEVDCFRRIADATDGQQKEAALRSLAEAQVRQDERLLGQEWHSWRAFTMGRNDTGRDKCSWFTQEHESWGVATELSGSLADSVSDKYRNTVAVETKTWLVPRDAYVDSHPLREMDVLLSEGDRPIAFRYRDRSDDHADNDYYWSSQNQLIFVNNGSFLLNYGLVRPAHRELASGLIDEAPEGWSVMFLESGPDGIQVSDSDQDGHHAWAWITKQPLCYMVPHFLIWGLLFCFAFFPIFGRPRRILSNRNRSFGDHIGAISRLLRRHQDLETTKAQVREYLKTSKVETRGKQKRLAAKK